MCPVLLLPLFRTRLLTVISDWVKMMSVRFVDQKGEKLGAR